MNFEEFINKYNNKSVEYDNAYPYQCVDFIKAYIHEVFNIIPLAIGNAHCYYDRYNELEYLQKNFIRISNTKDFIPIKGDIMVWNTRRGNGAGHVAICNGVGTKSYFCSYDQNWNGIKKVQLVKHTYSNVLGVLRPRNNSKLNEIKQGDTVAVDIRVAFTGARENKKVLVEYDKQQFWISEDKFNKDNSHIKTTGIVAYASTNLYIVEIIENKQIWIKQDDLIKL